MSCDAPPRAAPSRAVWAWALYDFANSPFTTLVVTFIYSTYFTQAIVGEPVRGTVLWSRGVTLSALVVAVLAPLLGAVADRGGTRKRFLGIATAGCVLATAGLYAVVPGHALAALLLFSAANVFYETGMVFYNALLPAVAPPGRLGRVSGLGWALGYLGGLLALVVALVSLVQPEVPWFGFSREAGQHIRATNLLVAAWFAVFSLPLFIWVPETAPGTDLRRAVREGLAQLASTFRRLREFRTVALFLVARLFYNDGLITVFAFGGIYAAGTFGFTMEEILVFGIALNVAAGTGAWLFGHLDDRIGSRRTILLSLCCLVTATVLAAAAPSRGWFWAAAVLLGVFIGPTQSSSRALLARLAPRGMENEFFGFFAFSGKFTAFLGPMLLGLVTGWTGSQRAGIGVVAAFFVVGLGLLLLVREPGTRRGEDPGAGLHAGQG